MVRTEKFNYTYSDLEKYSKEVNDAIDYYEYRSVEGTTQNIFLANGERIRYRIDRQNIAHLLGIDTTYLINSGKLSPQIKNSSGVLNLVRETTYEFYNICKSLDMKKIFSEYSFTKKDLFKDNIQINVNDIAFVCDYKKERTYGNTEKCLDQDCYIIARYNKDNDGLNFLYLVENKNGIYKPKSTTYYETKAEAEEAIKPLISKQVLTLATGVQVLDKYGTQTFIRILFPSQKQVAKAGIDLMKNDAIIDVNQDYSLILRMIDKQYNLNNSKIVVLAKIAELLKNRELITEDKLDTDDIPPELKKVIDLCNDLLCSNTNEDKEKKNEKSFSEIKQQLIEAKATIEKSKKELELKDKELESLREENETLKKDSQILGEVRKLVIH